MSFSIKTFFFIFLFVSINIFGNDGTALIVIDFQPEMWVRTKQHEKEGNVEKLEKMKAAVLKTIELAKEENLPIVLIKFKDHGPIYSEVLKSLEGYPHAKTILKDSDGIFESDGLMTKKNSFKEETLDYLNDKKIKNLVMIGANGWACVRSSVKGAMEHNYNTIVFDRAVADFNSDNFKYPYVSDYRLNQVTCDDCSFRRVSEFQEISLIFANANKENSNNSQVHVIDFNRNPKEDSSLDFSSTDKSSSLEK